VYRCVPTHWGGSVTNAHDSSIGGAEGLQNEREETEIDPDSGWPWRGSELGEALAMADGGKQLLVSVRP
jgi:hypothetical protein